MKLYLLITDKGSWDSANTIGIFDSLEKAEEQKEVYMHGVNSLKKICPIYPSATLNNTEYMILFKEYSNFIKKNPKVLIDDVTIQELELNKLIE